MSDDRRYHDDEIAKILDLAVTNEESQRAMTSTDLGLTLAELQAVGLEVGVDPSRIAAAAQTLDTKQSLVPRRTSLGMPVSVSRVIDLPREVSDREWDLLVSEFRQTFAAQGQLAARDGSRVWKNGNLRASLEPTPTGHRLRLETTKGGAENINGLGVGIFSIGIVALATIANSGSSPLAMELVMLWSFAAGIVMLGSNALRLPGWARAREEQMEYIDMRVRRLITAESPDGEG